MPAYNMNGPDYSEDDQIGPEYAPRIRNNTPNRKNNPRYRSKDVSGPFASDDEESVINRDGEKEGFLGQIGSLIKTFGRYIIVIISFASALLIFLILALVLAVQKPTCISCAYFGIRGFPYIGDGLASIVDSDFPQYQCDSAFGKSQHLAFLSRDIMIIFGSDNSTPMFCGKCIKISSPDNFVLARISGVCKNCTLNDIAVSETVFNALLPPNPSPNSPSSQNKIEHIPVNWGPCAT
ncbi:hypothetical protein BB560_000317 [Smittium megazygosporum]|uniref:RlpA-like protein double-psi beta-barrel domain-containing protein n=1 Tax=Smittium megazygosporum TaxID=133381 RepID=A0A2T9ZKQ4_9FUNG|nr:hypothetical protein BB560_000317 [Smittium megazygosporum]